MEGRFYGSEAQQRMAALSCDLWHLAGDNPRLCWNGRLVSMSAQTAHDPLALAIRLVRLQGATSIHYLPLRDVSALAEGLAARGFVSLPYHQCEGGRGAYERARERLTRTALPPALSPVWLDKDSSRDLVEGLGNLAVSVGVTPACEAAMRGLGPSAAVLALCDPSGAVVAGGMSFLGYPSTSRHRDQAFWGMLATRPDWRGRGLGSFVGASLIVSMWERKGARGFFTGVADDNQASERLCAGLGVVRGPNALLGCTDPAVFGSGGITR